MRTIEAVDDRQLSFRRKPEDGALVGSATVLRGAVKVSIHAHHERRGSFRRKRSNDGEFAAWRDPIRPPRIGAIVRYAIQVSVGRLHRRSPWVGAIVAIGELVEDGHRAVEQAEHGALAQYAAIGGCAVKRAVESERQARLRTQPIRRLPLKSIEHVHGATWRVIDDRSV